MSSRKDDGMIEVLPADKVEPCILEAVVFDYGQCVGVRLRERDGTISTIRITVEQLAD